MDYKEKEALSDHMCSIGMDEGKGSDFYEEGHVYRKSDGEMLDITPLYDSMVSDVNNSKAETRTQCLKVIDVVATKELKQDGCLSCRHAYIGKDGEEFKSLCNYTGFPFNYCFSRDCRRFEPIVSLLQKRIEELSHIDG